MPFAWVTERRNCAPKLELRLGNRLRAAQILGIGRTSLYRYLKCMGMKSVLAKKAVARQPEILPLASHPAKHTQLS
jgi:hypothetical protein